MTNYQKKPRDGAAQEQVRRKHGGGVQEARNWRHDPHRDRQGLGRRSMPEKGRIGSRNGSRNGGRSTEHKRAKPQGLDRGA